MTDGGCETGYLFTRMGNARIPRSRAYTRFPLIVIQARQITRFPGGTLTLDMSNLKKRVAQQSLRPI